MGDYQLTVLVFSLLFIYNTNSQIFQCFDNSDCIDEATCENNICECPRGKVFNRFGDKCLDLIIDISLICEEDAQCSLLQGGYICGSNKKCDCSEGWHYFQGKCTRTLNLYDDCTEDIDCFDGRFLTSKICKDNKCVCNDGYYERSGLDCRPEAKNEGDYCNIDLDCKGINHICDNAKCKAPSKTDSKLYNIQEEVFDFTYINEYCDDTKKCTMAHTTCVDNVCVCEDNYTWLNNKCLKECRENDDCVTNSYCSPISQVCVCDVGYFDQKDKCLKELGMDCTIDEDCGAPDSFCIGNKCTCENKQMSGNKQNCLNVATSPVFRCSTDYSCITFGKNYQCLEEGLEKVCRCTGSYSLNKETICSDLGCRCDKDCTTIKNSNCGANGVCVCSENSLQEGDICYQFLGEICTENNDCSKVENAECSENNVCACKTDFSQKSNTECVPVAELEEKCSFDEQCTNDNTICSEDEKVCVCKENYVPIDGYCLEAAEKIGDSCTHHDVCSADLGPNVICRSGKCQCDVDMSPTVDLGDCVSDGNIPIATNLLLIILFLTYFVV